MWKQRSEALWLQAGDQNTKFFHNRASHRYRRNQIEELKNDAGVVCSHEEEISNRIYSTRHPYQIWMKS